MSKRYRTINGHRVDLEKFYPLQDTAPILGVTTQMVQFYVHSYKVLIPTHITPKVSVLRGDQIAFFHDHKREMLMKRRRLLRDQREELRKHQDITEEWMKAPPIDNTWAENFIKERADAVDPLPVEEVSDSNEALDDFYD